MKKTVKTLLMLTCMLTCVLGLTACGSDDTISEFQQSKIDAVEEMAPNVITLMSGIVTNNDVDELTANYNNVELGDLYESTYYSSYSSSIQCDGKGVKNAFVSFQSGIEECGSLNEMGEATSVVDDDTIIVTIPVTMENGTASVELIFSNDIYMELQSCTLNIDRSFGELMEKAVLNTLIGMGTVFIVLIMISWLISLFALMPKIQAKLAGKQTAEQPKSEPAAAPVPAAAAAPAAELAGDEELAAVIAAAIAAYEGTSTDGFRVRSIKRAANSTWRRA